MSRWWDIGPDGGDDGDRDAGDGVRVDQSSADADVERLLKTPALPDEPVAAKDFSIAKFFELLRKQNQGEGRGDEQVEDDADSQSSGRGIQDSAMWRLGATFSIGPGAPSIGPGAPSGPTYAPMGGGRAPPSTPSAADSPDGVRLHTRAGDAILFERGGVAAPEDVFGRKLAFFLNGMGATLGKESCWAYAAPGQNEDDKYAGRDFDVKIKRKTAGPLEYDEPASVRMPFVRHRARLIQHICTNATELDGAGGGTASEMVEKVKLKCGSAPIWEPIAQSMLDVSVDERLSQLGLDYFRELVKHYNFPRYTSPHAASLMQHVEDAIRSACADDPIFEGQWLAKLDSATTQSNPRTSEVEFVYRILEMADRGRDREELMAEALVLLITMAQVGRFDDMSSEHGVATRLLFDERPFLTNVVDFHFVCFYEARTALGPSPSAGSGAHPREGAGGLPDLPTIPEESGMVESSARPRPAAAGAPADGGAPAGADPGTDRTAQNRAEPSEKYVEKIYAIVEKFRKGKLVYLRKIEKNRSARHSKFITDPEWRVNYYKLARAIFAENAVLLRSVVSARERRLREAEAEKREALYFFQAKCGRARKIARMYIPGS